jgi:hypothetical protein
MTEGQAAGLPSRTPFTLGFAPGAMPGSLVILCGTALGPYGLGLLSAGVLESFDPAMPVALAALGVFVGIQFNLRIPRDWQALAATSLHAGVTMGIVGAGVALLAQGWAAALEPPAWFNGVVLAIGAADGPLPVLLGGVALAFLREAPPGAAGMLLLQATGVTLAIAAAGWLLLSQSTEGPERRIFVIALLLLLGGASDYLLLSALTGGLIAGVLWEAADGSTRKAIWSDLLYVQRPLILLVLVVSGARLEVTPLVLAIGLPCLALRLLGSMAGSAAARRLFPGWPSTDTLTSLSPGIVGLAFALNAVRAAGPDAATVLSIVVVGAVGSELLAPILRPREAVE